MERRFGFDRFVADAAGAARTFLGAAPGSLKHHLNRDELCRVTVTALAAGGGLLGLLQAIVAAAGTIFPAPTDAALAAAILTVILDILRRLEHGDPSPGPAIPARVADAGRRG